MQTAANPQVCSGGCKKGKQTTDRCTRFLCAHWNDDNNNIRNITAGELMLLGELQQQKPPIPCNKFVLEIGHGRKRVVIFFIPTSML